jgi:hypothetical protein
MTDAGAAESLNELSTPSIQSVLIGDQCFSKRSVR